MISNQVVVENKKLLTTSVGTTLEPNTYDTVIYTGGFGTIILPRTFYCIDNQYITFYNKGSGGLNIVVQGLDIIDTRNGLLLNFVLQPGKQIKLLVDLLDIKWVVDTSASYIVTSTPNYLANRVVNTWTNRLFVAAPGQADVRMVAWSPQLGIFCGIAGQANGDAYTSPDGVIWTRQTTPAPGNWFLAICWAAELGLFVAASYRDTGAPGQQIMTSPNGIVWTLRNSTSGNYSAITWSSQLNRLVAVSEGGGVAAYSSDGINWAGITVPITDIRSICWAAELGLFVAVGHSESRVMTSPDGIVWTARIAAANNNWKGVCWSAEVGLLVAVAENGTDRVMTSPDGINWTIRSCPAAQWYGVCWAPELGIYAAVAYDNGTNQIMVSSNGVNWTLKASAATTTQYRFICWSPELSIFCAVGGRAMTSAMNARLPTSYNTFDNVFNNISELGLWNFRSFGRNAPRNVTSNYSILPGDNWISVNSGTVTLTLPKAGDNPGLELMVKNISGANTTFSAAAGDTLVNAIGGALTTIATGTWITLVSNGITSWVTTQL